MNFVNVLPRDRFHLIPILDCAQLLFLDFQLFKRLYFVTTLKHCCDITIDVVYEGKC